MSSPADLERHEAEQALFNALHDASSSDEQRAAARDALVETHLPLVRHLARRYAERGEPMEDVIQAGTIGLIQAVDRFEPDRGVAFSTYAVPTVVGAIRRHFRDATWSMKVPRRVQELRGKIDAAHDSLTQDLGRSPTVAEIAERASVDAQDVLDSLELSRVREMTQIDAVAPDGAPLADRIGDLDASLAGVDDAETVKKLLDSLPEQERIVVKMRFFDGMSQSEIASKVGVSQMQVSRLLSRSLAKLRADVDVR